MATSLRLALIVALALLGACAAPPPPTALHYYQLSPQAATATHTAARLESLGVGPIIWPEYLDRRQLLTRIDANTLKAADNERWAEPLESGFARVMRENLARQGIAQRILVYPWSAAMPPAQAIRIEVLQFDSDSKGVATLRASWRIVDARGIAKGADQVGEWHSTATDVSPAAAVAAQGATLARMAEALARSL